MAGGDLTELSFNGAACRAFLKQGLPFSDSYASVLPLQNPTSLLPSQMREGEDFMALIADAIEEGSKEALSIPGSVCVEDFLTFLFK